MTWSPAVAKLWDFYDLLPAPYWSLVLTCVFLCVVLCEVTHTTTPTVSFQFHQWAGRAKFQIERNQAYNSLATSSTAQSSHKPDKATRADACQVFCERKWRRWISLHQFVCLWMWIIRSVARNSTPTQKRIWVFVDESYAAAHYTRSILAWNIGFATWNFILSCFPCKLGLSVSLLLLGKKIRQK